MNWRERVAALQKQAEAIKAKADGEKRDLTAEESAEIVKICKDRDDARAAGEKADKEAEAASKALASGADWLNQPQPRRAAPGNPAATIDVREAFLDDPSRGYKTPRAFLMDVMAASRYGRASKPLESLQSPDRGEHGLAAHAFKAAAGADEQSTFSDPYGGFLIPKTLAPGLLQLAPPEDPMPNVRRVPMASPQVKFVARVDKTHTSSVTGGLRVYRRAEADTSASSRMELEEVVLNATGLFGVAYATEEVLSDSPISFAALLESGFRDEFASKLITERLYGMGAGDFEGINNTPALISVAKETGQLADTIVYENIVNMRARCWGYSRATWYANNDTVPQMMLLNQFVGIGGVPVWQPSAREDIPDTLLGRPIIFGEYPDTLGNAGDILLCNWEEYLEGTYEPLQSASSIHVRFINHERTFKFWMRNAGAPWWRAALTPKKSSTTLSPFIRLAARA